jgi:DNA polymerase-1
LLGKSGAPRTSETHAAETQAPLPHGRGSSGGTDDGFADNLFGDSAMATMPPQLAQPVLSSAPPPGFTTADNGEYRCITTQAQLDEVVAALRACRLFALDTETIGLGHRAALVGISLAWEPGKAVYIPVRSPRPADHLDAAAVLRTLEPVFMNPGVGKCGHNLNYDLLVLDHAGVGIRGVVFDSMIASHLLNQPAHGLDDLAAAFLKHHMTQISELIGHSTGRGGPRQGTMDQVALPAITRYASDDAEVSLRLYHALEPMLETLGMQHLAADVEMPLVEVLVQMQSNGIRVDPAVLAEQKKVLALRITELRDQIHEAAGMPFNIDSPKQLAEVLFDHLGLPKQKRTKTGLSTDIEVLEKLADLEGLTKSQAAVPILMVEYRQLSKLVSTYLDALRDAIDKKTGRVHAQFHQTGAATGRLSSSNPNLQNIPVRTEIGRQVRKAFIAEPGHLLISADYSQIELRILAHLSGDPGLIDAFAHDQDIHTAVAAQVFGVAPEAVTREQRGHAKVINFGIVYGVTPYGLARRIEGLDTERAKALIADYKKRFAGIDAFLQQCVEQAIRQGYVTTMLGRRRPIREITSANGSTRALGERLAINSVVQGSAADLIKLAMVNLHRRIEREKLPLKLLLQIHDELVLEAPADAAAPMAEIVRAEMEQAAALRVPLQVEAGVGPDWLAAK